MPVSTVSPYVNLGTYAVGRCTRGPVNSWVGARSATTSTTTSQTTNFGMQAQAIPGQRGVSYQINRTFAWYDLTSFTTGGNQISAITAFIPVTSSPPGVTTDAIIVKGEAFSNNTGNLIASTDIDEFSIASADTYSTAYAFPSSNTSISLNANAVTAANADTKLGVCHMTYDYDYLGTDPYPGGAVSVNFNNVINSTTPSKISIQVTYAASGWNNEMNGVPGASIGQVNGMNIGDIASINGIL